MSMVDFSRGELSPSMRYRRDLEAYHKGVASLKNFLPDPKGGCRRRPGSQVLELIPLPAGAAPSAIRTFNLGATGLPADIDPPAETSSVVVGDETYDTKGRVHPIPKNSELQIVLVFTEPDDIAAYWINTPNRIPAYLGSVFNLVTAGYERPSLGFDDTRDVRIVQIENSVYIVAQSRIHRLYWDLEKVTSAFTWADATDYEVGDVVKHTVGTTTWYFECIEEHTSVEASEGTPGNSPEDLGASTYWEVVYRPYLSWETVSPRVGHEMLRGAGIDDDPYTWLANTYWGSDMSYERGDVVEITGSPSTFWECIDAMENATITSELPSTYATKWRQLPAVATADDSDFITEDAPVRLRSSYAYREEVIPRVIVAHHNRLVLAGSSTRPSTMFGSEVAHFLNHGAGIYDNEPWTFTLSGDLVGSILWMAVTDQLYIGTSGGLFAVSGVITPTQFQLRRVTSHSASMIEGLAVSGGNLVFFQKDRRTLREVAYADQAQNYNASDLTVYSDHLFKDCLAVKMAVMHNPTTTLWILREDGALVSLTYESTIGMFAFAVHEFQGKVIDICSGVGDDLYAVVDHIENSVVVYRELLRIGDVTLTDDNSTFAGFSVDGMHSKVNIDTYDAFMAAIPNQPFASWMYSNGVMSVTDMLARTAALDASAQEFGGTMASLMLHYFTDITSLDISGNLLTGSVPYLLRNCAELVTLDMSDNDVTLWYLDTIPAKLKNLDVSNNDLTAAQVKKILVALKDHMDATSIVDGTVDLSGLPVVAMGMGLEEAIALSAAGWTVTLANAGSYPWGWNVTYDANTGTGTAPTAQSVAIGGTYTLPANPFTKTSHRFVGWDLSASGSGSLEPGTVVTKTTEANLVYYAIWEELFSISYRSTNATSGAAPTDTTEYEAGDTITVLGNTGSLARTHYTWTCWNSSADGTGVDFDAGDTIIMGTGAVILYPKWTPVSYTLSFNGNGSTSGTPPAAISTAYGLNTTIPTTTIKKEVPEELYYWPDGDYTQPPQIANYNDVFYMQEWNTLSNGSGLAYQAGETIFMTANVTLYAIWREFRVGETGPGGGVVFKDYGTYDRRAIVNNTTMYGSVKQETYRVFRYVEATKTDQGEGAWSKDKTFSISGYADWELPRRFGVITANDEWFDILYNARVALGIGSSFTKSKYWCNEWQNIWWVPNGFRLTVPGLSASYEDSNSSVYGYRPMRRF